MNQNSKQLKIVIVTLADLPLPSVKGGAVETLIDNICDQNEYHKKFEIDIFSITGAEDCSTKKNTKYYYYKNIKEKKITIKNILYKTMGKVVLNRTMKNIIKQINQKKYDCVIVTSIVKEIACFSQKCKFPVIWYLHGDAVEVLGQEWVYRIAQKCKGVITVSDYVSNKVRKTGVSTPVYTVRNCGDISPIEDLNEDKIRKEIRKSYNVNNEILYAYIGRIVPIKGVRELLIAFNKAKRTDSKLLIVGKPDSDHEQYYSEVKNCANDSVIFTGYIPHSELNKIYCAVDVVVVPSICNEAASLTVVESQQCGKYVIASNRGGVSEYSSPGMTELIEGTGEVFVQNLADSIESFDIKKCVRNKKITKFTQENLYKEFTEGIFKIYYMS